jgi:hypothetical protein
MRQDSAAHHTIERVFMMSKEAAVYLEQLRDMSKMLEQLIDEVPAGWFNQRPGKGLNPVGWNYFHLLRIWDMDLNWKCRGQKPENDAWHRGDFSTASGYSPDGKGGLGLGLGYGYSDDEVDEVQISANVLKTYQQMLIAEAAEYLDAADEEELQRRSPSILNTQLTRSNAERMQHTIAHSHGHIGEIRYALGVLGWHDESYPGGKA